MSLRELPSVERVLQSEAALALAQRYGRPRTVEAVRQAIEWARHTIRDGGDPPSLEELIAQAEATLTANARTTLRPVINATGVILHTNLGRAPISAAALAAVSGAAAYCTLEYDIERGRRSKRDVHVETLLTRLTGAEAAMVVTNNAAAVLLALAALARRKNVLVSRSQLVEIGGGFRIPEVMRQSGARLVEVGTTNRTHLYDFDQALDEHSALILVAHHSNFRIIGFTAEPDLQSLAQLGDRHGIPVLHDLGSGALLDTAAYGLGHEPTVQESVQAGSSLVCFSGDKLLGGPQAGILLGRKILIDRLKKHPLARAVRPDKLCLAALQATLIHYWKDEAEREIPVWKMIALSARDLRRRAESWRDTLGTGDVMESRSTVGGGSLPEETLPTWVLALSVTRPGRFLARLRQGDPPIVARVERDRVLLDPRTVLEEEQPALLRLLARLLKDASSEVQHADVLPPSSSHSGAMEELDEV